MRDIEPKDIRRIEVLIERLIDTGSNGGAADARALKVLLANAITPPLVRKVKQVLERDRIRTEGTSVQVVNRLANHVGQLHRDVTCAKRVIGYLMCDDDLDSVDQRSDDVNETEPSTSCIHGGPTSCIHCGPTRRTRRPIDGQEGPE